MEIIRIVHSDTANHWSKLFELEKLTLMIGYVGVDDTGDVQFNDEK